MHLNTENNISGKKWNSEQQFSILENKILTMFY